MCRAPSPNRRGSLSASTAASTRSRLSSGSPMPMNTMFVSRLTVGGQSSLGVARLVDDLRRPPGLARTRARQWRRTGNRPRSRPGSRCTACAARGRRRAPGSASAPTRSAHRRRVDGAPSRSGRRRRAGSPCRPPCRSRNVVGEGVAERRPAASGCAADRSRRHPSRRRRRSAAPDRTARRAPSTHAASSSGVRPEMPGVIGRRGHGTMLLPTIAGRPRT